MIKQLVDHHHYNQKLIDSKSDRVALYERYVIDLLLSSDLSDSQRDSSIAFELKHHHSTAQFARVLAKKRGLNEDVCCVGALLHDLYVIVFGSYVDHAHKSADLAEKTLNDHGLFSYEEKAEILKLIYNHSDKDVWSDDPYEEFGKDVDILDSFLYPNAYGYYLKHKKLKVFYNYIKRAKLIWNEMCIPTPICFSALDHYEDSWLTHSFECSFSEAINFLAFFIQLCEEQNRIVVPTYCITQCQSKFLFHFNKASFTALSNDVLTTVGLDLPSMCTAKDSATEGRKTEAQKLLSEAVNQVLIIWSSLDSYELVEPNTNPNRIYELGINATQQEE